MPAVASLQRPAVCWPSPPRGPGSGGPPESPCARDVVLRCRRAEPAVSLLGPRWPVAAVHPESCCSLLATPRLREPSRSHPGAGCSAAPCPRLLRARGMRGCSSTLYGKRTAVVLVGAVGNSGRTAVQLLSTDTRMSTRQDAGLLRWRWLQALSTAGLFC